VLKCDQNVDICPKAKNQRWEKTMFGGKTWKGYCFSVNFQEAELGRQNWQLAGFSRKPWVCYG
jgi:hypothetical protein